MKKLLSVLLAAVMLFSMFTATSIVTQAKDMTVSTSTEAGFFTSISDFFERLFQSIDDFFAELFDAGKDLPDVTEWTDEQIIEYYKEAVAKTEATAVTKEILSLNYFDIGNDSINDSLEVIMKRSMNNSKSEFAGINGDYEKLAAKDCDSVEAYKKGRYIVVELSFIDQSDSFKNEKVFVNTISHGMDVIGDKEAILNLGEDIKYDLADGDITIDYTNAKILVRINSNGYIKKGTWTYDCSMTFENVEIKFADMVLPMDYASAGFNYTGKVGGIF